MPLLNLSAALSSPMLLDSFTVQRRVQSVNEYGEASTASTASTASGVVYPSTPNDLQRLPDAQIQAKCITVITQFALRGESEAGGASYQPDLVVWHGDSFIVKDLEDFSSYGPGFVSAICTSIDLVDQPPAG